MSGHQNIIGISFPYRIAEHWNFQTAELGDQLQQGRPAHGGATDASAATFVPFFGAGRKEREARWARECVESAGGVSVAEAERHLERRLRRPHLPTKPPAVADIIGRALDKIGSYGKLNNKEHVRPYSENNLAISTSDSLQFRWLNGKSLSIQLSYM